MLSAHSVDEVVRALDRRGQQVILVEGDSDRRAVEASGLKLGRDLHAEHVRVVAMGGATNIDAYLRALVPTGAALSGLVDEAQADFFARAVARHGLGADLNAAGFFVCVADLEDELIRALGTDAVQDVLAAEGELSAFRLFQRQPDQRERAMSAQLRRFLGTQSGRKIRFGGALVNALDAAYLPRPLGMLVDR